MVRGGEIRSPLGQAKTSIGFVHGHAIQRASPAPLWHAAVRRLNEWVDVGNSAGLARHLQIFTVRSNIFQAPFEISTLQLKKNTSPKSHSFTVQQSVQSSLQGFYGFNTKSIEHQRNSHNRFTLFFTKRTRQLPPFSICCTVLTVRLQCGRLRATRVMNCLI